MAVKFSCSHFFLMLLAVMGVHCENSSMVTHLNHMGGLGSIDH